MLSTLASALRKDVSHQVGIHPTDFPCIHIGDLAEVEVFWFSSTATAVDHLAHPPVPVLSFTRQDVTSDDDGHACSHVQELRTGDQRLVDAVIDGQE